MTHPPSCENARKPRCVCSSCGGALHGWKGWIRIVDATTTDEDFRKHVLGVPQRLDDRWRTFRDEHAGAVPGRPLGEALIDQVRLDVVESMRRNRPGPVMATFQGNVQTPGPWPPKDTERITSARPEQRRWTGLRPPPANYPIDRQVHDLGELMAVRAWDAVAADPKFADDEFRRELAASHFWCDLFVACARALTGFQGYLAAVPEYLTKVISSIVRTSGVSGDRRAVELLVGELVDRIWNAAMEALDTAFPLLAILRGPQAVRVFRVLALLCCPDPSRHPDVMHFAVRPLAQDAYQLVEEKTVERLRVVFGGVTEWDGPP